MRYQVLPPFHLQFDSHKRADYNFRSETLDWSDKRVYIPVPNKFQVNERNLGSAVPHLEKVPSLCRTEFPVNAALASKPSWDSSWHGGDPTHFEKEERRRHEEATKVSEEQDG